MFPSLLVGHSASLGSPFESILVEKFGTLQLRSELVQWRPEYRQLQTLHALNELPKPGDMKRHTTSDFIGRGHMVMAALVKEKEPTHRGNLLRCVNVLPKFRKGVVDVSLLFRGYTFLLGNDLIRWYKARTPDEPSFPNELNAQMGHSPTPTIDVCSFRLP